MDMAAVTSAIAAVDIGDAATAIMVVVVSVWAFRIVKGLVGR